MNTFESIRTKLAPELNRLNDRIQRQLDTSNPLLQSIVKESLRAKGKLIRPIIVILSARMLGDVNDHVIEAAAAVELLHNASLIHDDVIDMTAVRRGNPTVNAVWGNHVAVLVGDYFVSSALQLAINTAKMPIVEQVCSLGKNLSLGELDQVYNAYHHTLAEDTYFRVIGYKTASLFMACARLGAYAQDIDNAESHALAEFARILGLAFQMRDDIFDYFDQSDVGKPTGNDLREGKITLPLLHVLLDNNAPGHDDMLQLARTEQPADDDIQRLIRYARDNGGIEYTYACMNELRDRATDTLDIFPDSEYKRDLLALFDFIIERKY